MTTRYRIKGRVGYGEITIEEFTVPVELDSYETWEDAHAALIEGIADHRRFVAESLASIDEQCAAISSMKNSEA